MINNLFIATLFVAAVIGFAVGFNPLFQFLNALTTRLIHLAKNAQLLIGYLARAYGRYRRNIERNLA